MQLVPMAPDLALAKFKIYWLLTISRFTGIKCIAAGQTSAGVKSRQLSVTERIGEAVAAVPQGMLDQPRGKQEALDQPGSLLVIHPYQYKLCGILCCTLQLNANSSRHFTLHAEIGLKHA